MTIKIVLALHCVALYVHVRIELVGFISILAFSSELVRHRSHEDIPDVVVHPAILDRLPILESQGSIANAVDCSRVWIRFDCERQMAVFIIVIVWPLQDVVRPRWMM